jgi:uncharacterized protein YjbI with pentapeptide repeats
MASKEHMDVLRAGVDVWNEWREENPEIKYPDLNDADISGMNLEEINFDNVRLHRSNLSGTNLYKASLRNACIDKSFLGGARLDEANLSGANFYSADIFHTSLIRAYLSSADLRRAYIRGANLQRVNLQRANLQEASLRDANLGSANLYRANLQGADFSDANLYKADIRRANLNNAILVRTTLDGADLTGCSIHGISVWDVSVKNTNQSNLIITNLGGTNLDDIDFDDPNSNESEITVDNLKIAQFIYLLLNNKEISDVITTITSKTVLILGRFTEERKLVLDALREELRKHNLLPIVFDFKSSPKRDLTETISTLAHMSRFIIADLTDAKSIPQELQAIVPHLPSVPVQPILHVGDRGYSMFEHFRRYPWVLETYCYQDIPTILVSIRENIVEPAEKKAVELEGRK